MALVGWFRSLFELVRLYFMHQSTYDELKDVTPLTPFMGKLLNRVYFAISGGLGFLSLGYGLDLYRGIGGLPTALGFLGLFICLYLTPRSREKTRICFLMVAAVLLGASMHHMIHLTGLFFTIDRIYFLKAFIGFALALGSYAIAVCNFLEDRYIIELELHLEEKRWMMYSLASLVSVGVFSAWLLCTENLSSLRMKMFFGFSLFMVYLAAYSQEIVVEFRLGNLYDCTQHAISLFTKIPAFLFHITCCFVWVSIIFFLVYDVWLETLVRVYYTISATLALVALGNELDLDWLGEEGTRGFLTTVAFVIMSARYLLDALVGLALVFSAYAFTLPQFQILHSWSGCFSHAFNISLQVHATAMLYLGWVLVVDAIRDSIQPGDSCTNSKWRHLWPLTVCYSTFRSNAFFRFPYYSLLHPGVYIYIYIYKCAHSATAILYLGWGLLVDAIRGRILIVVQIHRGNIFDRTQHAIALFIQMPAFVFHIIISGGQEEEQTNMPN
ncbi:hypothetical protein ACH5RR_026797 [Cinchona calisaya]|uniref:Uncharacterized protein n=1 Tax=Cinchona calisaya TaxID=153742 RepID=A0ABD2Z6Z6_9GENT